MLVRRLAGFHVVVDVCVIEDGAVRLWLDDGSTMTLGASVLSRRRARGAYERSRGSPIGDIQPSDRRREPNEATASGPARYLLFVSYLGHNSSIDRLTPRFGSVIIVVQSSVRLSPAFKCG